MFSWKARTRQKVLQSFIEGGQRPVTAAPRFGAWQFVTWLALRGQCMWGRCVDAIVDQLILGRFLADPGRLLADIVTMQFRCREFWRCSLVLDFCCGCYGGLFTWFLNGFLMKKWGAKTSNPSQIDQNWGQEHSKNDPGSKTFWVPPNTRYIGLEIWDLWHHLVDFGAI